MAETKRFCQNESAWQIVVGRQEGDKCIVCGGVAAAAWLLC